MKKKIKPTRRKIKFKGTLGHQYNKRVGKSILPDKFTPGPRYGKSVDAYKQQSGK